MTSPTLFIGDVHGCREELERLLEACRYHSGMKVVFVGDLINKGPDSAGVLRLFDQLNAQTVIGNHEVAFLKYMHRGHAGKPGFDALARSLGDDLPRRLIQMQSWPNYLETDDYLVVHAGLQPGKHPAKTDPRVLTQIRTWDGKGKNLWRDRDPPWYTLYKKSKPVVFGHWAVNGLVCRPNAYGLDTGCVYGGRLSGLVWPECYIVQVPARRVYQPPRSKHARSAY